MTPVERLEAAIAKLQQEEAESSPGRWEAVLSASMDFSWIEVRNQSDIAQLEDANHKADADLIVTLHRMLPSVLGWLRDQHARLTADLEARTVESQEIHYRHALALADAVLGGTE